MADMPHYWEIHKNQLNDYQKDYIELFELTNLTLEDFANDLPGLNKIIDEFNTIATTIDDEIDEGLNFVKDPPTFFLTNPLKSQDQNIRELKKKYEEAESILALLGDEGQERKENLLNQIKAARNNYDVFLEQIPPEDFKRLTLGPGTKTTAHAKNLYDITSGNAAAEAIGQEGTVRTLADTQYGSDAVPKLGKQTQAQ